MPIATVTDDDDAIVVLVEDDDALVVTVDCVEFIDALQILSFSIVDPEVEIGAVVQPAFVATYAYLPAAAVLTDDQGGDPQDVSDTPTSFTADEPYERTTAGAVEFTLRATRHGTVEATTSLTWLARAFFGVSASPAATEAFVESLGSRLQQDMTDSYDVDAGDWSEGKFIAIAFPLDFGDPTFFVDGGALAGGFTKLGNVPVTNVHGLTTIYQLWVSNQPGLGERTVEVA